MRASDDVSASLIKTVTEVENLCLSGGAEGADLQWGAQAGLAGHSVIHWSFNGHRSQAPVSELVQLTAEQLNKADDALARANLTIKRRWPSANTFTNNLLRRNWYQIKDTEAVYGVSDYDPITGASGGTAWAVQMYLDRFLHDGEPMEKCRAYVLDKITNHWYQFVGSKWELMPTRPKTPSGIWTGIGSREIGAKQKIEIRKLLGTYKSTDTILDQLHPIVSEPKVDDIIYVPDRVIPDRGSFNTAGGWATVRRVLVGDETFVCTSELFPQYEIKWSEIRDEQIELRSKFKFIRSHPKPDFSPENNTRM